MFKFLKNKLFGKKLDASDIERLRAFLLEADVGVEKTQAILKDLSTSFKDSKDDPDSLLKKNLTDLLKPYAQKMELDDSLKPNVILVVGVNGSGKTTSVAKLANYFLQQKKSVLLAAGDTFRAAAIDQLKFWGEKLHVPVVSQHQGSDSASVIFDAVSSAKAKNYDIVIADTAGRLHTENNLMNELAKVSRVLKKIDARYPNKVLLTIDGTFGQNSLNQAQKFQEAMGVDGLIATKLDGTAKCGILFKIVDTLKIPVNFIATGEKVTDFAEFNEESFIEILCRNL